MGTIEGLEIMQGFFLLSKQWRLLGVTQLWPSIGDVKSKNLIFILLLMVVQGFFFDAMFTLLIELTPSPPLLPSFLIRNIKYPPAIRLILHALI